MPHAKTRSRSSGLTAALNGYVRVAPPLHPGSLLFARGRSCASLRPRHSCVLHSTKRSDQEKHVLHPFGRAGVCTSASEPSFAVLLCRRNGGWHGLMGVSVLSFVSFTRALPGAGRAGALRACNFAPGKIVFARAKTNSPGANLDGRRPPEGQRPGTDVAKSPAVRAREPAFLYAAEGRSTVPAFNFSLPSRTSPPSASAIR